MTQKDFPLALITGASGFLGTALSRACRKYGFDVVGIDIFASPDSGAFHIFRQGRLEDCRLSEITRDRRPDVAFHLAGSASVPASVADPYGDFMSLLPGTARLCAEMRDYCPEARLVLFSSAAVYGNPGQLPIKEEMPARPVSPYGINKHLAEDLAAECSGMWGFPLTIMRIFSAYGPGLRKQLFWDVSQRAFEAVRKHQCTLQLYGTGSETRDFIYVEDVADAAIHLATNPARSKLDIVNVASGTETRIFDAVSTIIEQLGLSLSPKFGGQIRPGDPHNWRADVGRLRRTGFRCSVPLAKGLKAYAQWFSNERKRAHGST